MKDFIRLLFRLVPPYKKSVFLNVLNNFFSTLFSLFSFALVIPILEILFRINEQTYTYHENAWSLPAADIAGALKDNFYFFVSTTIEKSGGGATLLILGAFLIAMTFLKTGFAYMASLNMITIRTSVLRDLRNTIFEKVLNLPLGFFSEEKKGDIISRMSNDVTEVENSVMSSLDMTFKNFIMIIIYFTTLLIISWELTLFVLVLLPVAGFLMGRVSKQLKKPSRESQAQWGELLSQIEETLTGLRIIKAFNAENKIKANFNRQNETLKRTTKRIIRRQQLAHPMSEFLGTTIIAIVLWFGGSLILSESSHTITAPVFIYYLIIFYSIINPAKAFSQAWYNVQKGLASMERIDRILLTENHIADPEHPVDIKGFTEAIEYKNVSFKYQTEPVLENIDLKISKGQTVALVGQSGSGKSTLVDLLPRFYDVNSGQILIDGIDIRQVRVKDLRALMGNVNQEAILFNDSFYNNIAFGVKNASIEQVVQAAKIANAHDFIIATEQGYDTNIGDRGSKLSGGQRQRISIARAILKNPPILILDEATSALDTESEKLVQEALENLMKNRTTIVIAHRLSTIRNADLICVLHEGRIVERGTHKALLRKKGHFKKLYDLQALKEEPTSQE
ncbi:MAG TPA: ABC transporter ATP-binding protein [Bacteroidales bacterium]|jgi:ABC-type multidrug transport system fused ATPase/permease subunit|nr:ABC transporter ATP-binding protein [Bacteroidales bacterium]OQC02879.1 MAG: putative multidrug export ATP-binding/permease protein [Bacteroidetes bacterium ADurb.Bin090]HOD25758.1 ABC transporter ATP-binding protein [Bacteroidales bacterium]HPH56805.1 ABC transporter ATP-binding protein [Bacteroidales bacterium]HPY58949.1 ABC transporter ATP-binding protein [Bacteroidales bacterium]